MSSPLDNESPASTYVASLGDRPALFALTGLLASFPVVKVFASNSVPLLMSRQPKKAPEDPSGLLRSPMR